MLALLMLATNVDGAHQRLAEQHQQVDQSVAAFVWSLKLFYLVCYGLVAFSIFTLVDFYRHHDELTELSDEFRVAMGLLVLATFFVSNILLRTHGTPLSRIEISGLTMTFVCLLVLAVVPVLWLPPAMAAPFFFYMSRRRDNRKRVIVFVVVLIITLVATALYPVIDNVAYSGFFGAVTFGTGSAAIMRIAKSYRSGGSLFSMAEYETWWDYKQARENLQPLDIILESENRFAPSRITSLWSRSAWTHSGLLVSNLSDSIKKLYGIATHEELTAEIEELRRRSNPMQEQESAQLLQRLQLELDEELYVFEAVRPVVALTPLCTWMAAKEQHMPYKLLICRQLRMYESRASIQLDMTGIESLLREVHGFPFTLEVNRIFRANYQANTQPFSDSIFCSELVAEAYRRAGLLTEKRLSANYCPKDFSKDSKTTLLLNARLDEAQRLRAAPAGTPEATASSLPDQDE